MSANGTYKLQENDLQKGNANVRTVKNFYTCVNMTTTVYILSTDDFLCCNIAFRFQCIHQL